MNTTENNQVSKTSSFENFLLLVLSYFVGMPVVLVMFIYILLTKIRKQLIDMNCLDTIAKYLFYILIIDFTLEFKKS
jgi:hypothetical protein